MKSYHDMANPIFLYGSGGHVASGLFREQGIWVEIGGLVARTVHLLSGVSIPIWQKTHTHHAAAAGAPIFSR